jgi:hypothetical protein
VQAVRQERASEVFVGILGQLLAGGQVRLDQDMRLPEEPEPGTTTVGYRDAEYLYLLPEIAHREVNRVQPLRFTATAIGMQLREEGWLIPGKDNLTVQRRIRGSLTRLWRLKPAILGCDGCDTCDSESG